MKMSGKIVSAALLGTIIAGASFAAGGRGERFEELDSNGNGVVTHEELMAAVKARFDMFDKNDDGVLTLEELPKDMPVPEHAGKRFEKRMERMAERAEKEGRDMDEGELQSRFKPSRMQFIAKHDHDGDEQVSFEEFSSRAVAMFKRADGNGDGEITKTEMEEAAKYRHFGKRGGWDERGKRR